MKRWAGLALLVFMVASVWGFAYKSEHVVIGSFATDLRGRTVSQRHNAVLSAQALHGTTIGPGETFSFNACVGSFSRDRGYRKAPVSYNGQLIDSWGGGVCQTSTTLYNAALLADLRIVERNRHRFSPSYVPPGRDAAVAFNEIDLKFQNRHRFPVTIRTRAEAGLLRIEIGASERLKNSPSIETEIRAQQDPRRRILKGSQGSPRQRNSGKSGWEVATFRRRHGTSELISVDRYPAMDRVLEGISP